MKTALRSALVLFLALFAALAAAADGAWKTTDIGGIHYAISRNSLHPDRWQDELHHTFNCTEPCIVEFDERMSAVHLRYKWAQLNPEMGVYDFSDLGEVLDQIHAAGKMATLVVMAGKYTPSWVFDEGGHHIRTRLKGGGKFSQRFQPLPWDPIFLSSYGKLMDELAAFLKETPSRYDTLALVKNGGITVHSAETRMMPWKPFKHYGDMSNKGDRDTFLFDLCADWAQAGYSESKILDVAKYLNQRITTAFPDMYLGLAFVQGSKRFPTVNREGNCTYPEKNDTLNKIIRNTVSTYGNRAVVNNTVLAAGGDGQVPILDWVQSNGGTIGFQLKAQEIGCRDADAPCSKKAFEKAIQEGIDAGAIFIEVHDGNIDRFGDILPAMNQALIHNTQ